MNQRKSLILLALVLTNMSIPTRNLASIDETEHFEGFRLLLKNDSTETIHYRFKSTKALPICWDICSEDTGNGVTATVSYCCKNNGVGDLKPGESWLFKSPDASPINIDRIYVYPKSGGEWYAEPKQNVKVITKTQPSKNVWGKTDDETWYIQDRGTLTYKDGSAQQRGDFKPY